MSASKFIWKHLKGRRAEFVAGHIISVFTAMLVIIIPYISKILIDECIRGGRRDIFLPLIFTMCGVALFQACLKMIRVVMLELASQELLVNIRKTIFRDIQNQDMNFFNYMPQGDIITRTTGDLEYLRHFTAWVIYHFIEVIVMFTASITMLFFVSPTLTWFLLAVLPFLLVTSIVYSRTVRPYFRKNRIELSKLNGAAQENIDGNRVVKAFVREDYEIEKFAEKSDNFKNISLKASYAWHKITPVINFFAESLSIITLVAGGILVINDSITMGDLALFTSLTWALAMPMRMISMLLNDIQRFSTSAEKVMEICMYDRNIKDAEDAVEQTERFKGKISFENVTFSYGKSKILDDVSFVINPGETVVIMGPTGCGKTSLINLIMRFYDVQDGSVMIDDIDVRKRTLKSVRGAVAVATQDVFLFSDTIDGNIAFSDVDMSEEKVKECAEYACADEFIVHTPEGYETIIGERGVGLSGGQRQRIALARALAAEPAILILDDTTSAVDTDTEAKIQKALDNLPFNATKIMIAQRVSTSKKADRIFILEDGKISAGTHEELLETNEYYKNICEIQGVR